METSSNKKGSEQYYLENGVAKTMPFVPKEDREVTQVYEVLRAMEGKPLFATDHFERFQNSCHLLGINTTFDPSFFLGQLHELIRLNDLKEGNIKVELNRYASGETQLLFYPIPHQYPSPEQYQKGVLAGVLHAERSNPQAKVAQLPVREKANLLIRENNWFEVLLVDHEGCITEGSRSNVFFIRDGIFYTPPTHKVLSGITRKKVLECIERNGMSWRETDIPLADMGQFEAAFLTGTSPKILPIARIADTVFEEKHPQLRRLMAAFDRLIQDSISEK